MKREKMSPSEYKSEIVSREDWLQILLSPDSEVHIEILGLSRVAGNWNLNQRILPYHYMTLVTDSVNYVCLEGYKEELEPGNFLWISPGVPHSMAPKYLDRPHQFYHMQFSLKVSDKIITIEEPFLSLKNAHNLKDSFHALLETNQTTGTYQPILMKACLTKLVGNFFHFFEQSSTKKRLLNSSQQKTIKHLVNQRDLIELTPEILAQKLRLNHDYFSRIFKSTYGYSPRTWLMHERMRKAASLLAESTLSISEISHKIGYDDIYVFSKLFKKVHNLSPRNYRQSL